MLRLLLLFTFFSSLSAAENNSLWMSQKDPVLISFERMDLLIAQVAAVYDPIFASKGLKLEFIKQWDSLLANAYTERVRDIAQVHVHGGLARAPYMTEDHFTLIICHELGHHLGGQPNLKSGPEAWWASAEPQADYFATKECMKRVLLTGQGEANVPSSVRDSCRAVYSSNVEREVCTRSALAAELFAQRDYRLNHYGEDPKVPLSLLKPFKKIPDLKYYFGEYPDSQCRMDTLYQGSLCNQDDCDGGIGGRPYCWLSLVTKK